MTPCSRNRYTRHPRKELSNTLRSDSSSLRHALEWPVRGCLTTLQLSRYQVAVVQPFNR